MRIGSDFTTDEVGSLVQLEAKKNVLTVSDLLVSVNASGQVFGYSERSESSLKMIAAVSLTSLVVIVAIIVGVIKKVRSTDQNNQKEDQIDQKMNI